MGLPPSFRPVTVVATLPKRQLDLRIQVPVEDMGQLVVYLACAPHVTGQAIAVDGGFSL
mgnify:CR=1 FL=1